MDVLYVPPNSFWSATMTLSAAEVGALMTMIALLAKDERPIPRDDVRLARVCGCTPRKFRQILTYLKERELMAEEAGLLHSPLLEQWLAKPKRRPIPMMVAQAVRDRDGERCAYCGDEDGPFHLDHVYPWSRGGKHDVDNLVVACRSCNLSKSDKTLEEWRGTMQ